MDIGSKIKHFRKQRGLTIAQLARDAQVSPSFISQAERNLISPSIATLKAIADALSVPLVEFFQEDPHEVVVYRAPQGRQPKWRVVTDSQVSSGLGFFVCHLNSGERSSLRLDGPIDGEELGYVLKGTVSVGWDKQERELKTGDTIYFRTVCPRRVQNRGRSEAAVLWMRTGAPVRR